jgi:hypothetical protein
MSRGRVDRRQRARIAALWSCLLCLPALAPLAVAGAPASVAGQAVGRTIGLVLTDWRYALYQTPGLEECPAGLQPSEVLQFKALPDPLGHLNKFGGTTQNRGPIGENANYSPLAVEDPLPFRELKTKVGYGFNLDGTADGHATPKTVAHEKFTSPEGEPVDNQMARVLGCVQGWRKTGFMAEFYSKEVETSPVNRHLIEITGVDDETNDPAVEVAIYKGRDRLVRAASGDFIPLMSHRIDDRFPQFIYKTRGKIVAGVLITEPIPLARLPLLQIQIPEERRIRDLTLRLKLTATGAEGLLGGYEDLAAWWNNHSKSPGSDVGRYSPAALYRALHRYADGYPDPADGRATAISVAYQVSAVRALIVHPAHNRAGLLVAQSGTAR